MSVTFRFFPSGNTFSNDVKSIFKKLDLNASFGEDKGENYAQIKINEHFLTMPEEFFPSILRRVIQKELKKITVMEDYCVPTGKGPGNNTKHMIGDVEISVTGYNNYFFVGHNITGMIRAIIIAKKLKSGLKNYASPSHFFTEGFMITKEIKNLTQANALLKKEVRDTNFIHQTVLNEAITKAKNLEEQKGLLEQMVGILTETNAELKKKKPSVWKFWLWKF